MDGEQVDVTTEGDGLEVTMEAGGVQISAAPASQGGTSSGSIQGTTLQIREGGGVALDAAGLLPDSQVFVWILSEPTLIGEFTVSDAGSFEGVSMLPDGLIACGHTLQVVGTTTDGEEIALSLGIQVLLHPYPYIDTYPNSTHGYAIGCVTDLGIATGFSGTIYGPGRSVTRGQLASMLLKTLGIAPADSAPFSDTDDGVHAGAIGALAERGIVGGYPDGTYRPNEPVSRGQIASMLGRALGLEPGDPSTFSDTEDSVHGGMIAALADAGIMSGFSDGTARPAQHTTRAQMATLLVGVLETIG